MDNFFKVDFNGQVILVAKNSVEFKGKLGIVKAYASILVNGHLEDYLITGVVDDNFQVVVDYRFKQMLPKIDIMGEDNLVCIADINENFINPEYHVVVYNYGFETVLDEIDYQVVDDETVILQLNFKGVPCYSLYNLRLCTHYVQVYNYIGEFKFREEFQDVVAPAEIFVPNQEGFCDILSFYINKESKVVSGYKYKEQVYDGSYTLNEVLSMIKESLSRN